MSGVSHSVEEIIDEKTATQLEVSLLEFADFCMDNTTNEKAREAMSVVQALYQIYYKMTEFQSKFPNEAAQALFVQHWGTKVAAAYEEVISQAIDKDPNLIFIDWHRERFDPRLTEISSGPNGITAMLRFLDNNRQFLPAEVSTAWESAASKFHRETGGDCGGGCPSTGCGAKSLMEQIRQNKGVRNENNDVDPRGV